MANEVFFFFLLCPLPLHYRTLSLMGAYLAPASGRRKLSESAAHQHQAHPRPLQAFQRRIDRMIAVP